MDSFIFAVNAVMPIVLTVALGYILKRVSLLPIDVAKSLNRVVFRVLLPANLFLNVYTIESLSDIDFGFGLYALGATLVLFFLGLIYVRFATEKPERRGALMQAIFRSNFALIGVSLASALFGAEGERAAALLSAFIVPLFNILAVIALTVFEPVEEGATRRRISIKKILLGIIKNPLALSVFLGLAVLGIRMIFVNFDLQFRLSDIVPVYKTLEMLSRSATTLALLALGAQFEFSAVREMRREIITATLTRILFVPLIGVGFALLVFDFTGAEYAALLAAFATPVAVSSVPMAQEMRGDAVLAGQIVVWTTVCSSATLFLFVFALRAMGIFT